MSKYFCPECESYDVLVYAMESYEINTGNFFCHSVKIDDSDAPCRCMHCNWSGYRMNLEELNAK